MNKSLPVLLISGSDDPVGDYGKGVDKVEQMFISQELKRVDKIIYPEARHELINEINKQEVYKDLLNWIFKIFPN